jgi:hypothetical protein
MAAGTPRYDPSGGNVARVERLVLIPVLDDWEAVSLLIPQIDAAMQEADLDVHVLVVDDGSTIPSDRLSCPSATAVRSVDVLALRRNLGHQRAIAVGLTFAHDRINPATVILMDGDGEDDPREAVRLLRELEATGGSKIVFAERRRRSETLLFRLFYRLYRGVHFALTGTRVRVGNFSVVPASALARLVVVSEMWNHYAAAVFNARIGYTTVPTARGRRLVGESRMNFTSLVVHGLSALSVYSHIIGVRLLVLSAVLGGASAVALASILVAQVAGVGASPGWLLPTAAVLLAFLFQAVTAAVLFVFVTLGGRQASGFIPLRDYSYFVDRVQRVWPRL